MEVKIQIPDNCKLIKNGDTYIVKEKKDKPRSWEEFCKNYPIKKGEVYIDGASHIENIGPNYITDQRDIISDKNICTSEEEAEAFLALMQLRQLRKAWVGDWEYTYGKTLGYITYSFRQKQILVDYGCTWHSSVLSFPTKEMAEEFLKYFKDLCETAKILL